MYKRQVLYGRPVLHVEPVLPQAVSKSYYKLYLPWGELSLYEQLDAVSYTHLDVYKRQGQILAMVNYMTQTLLALIVLANICLLYTSRCV